MHGSDAVRGLAITPRRNRAAVPLKTGGSGGQTFAASKCSLAKMTRPSIYYGHHGITRRATSRRCKRIRQAWIRGSTTRRIADEAGVNEITIFRQFGTKDALIHAAIACSGCRRPRSRSCPKCRSIRRRAGAVGYERSRARLRDARTARRCMSEREEHPQLIATANRGPTRAASDLQRLSRAACAITDSLARSSIRPLRRQ